VAAGLGLSGGEEYTERSPKNTVGSVWSFGGFRGRLLEAGLFGFRNIQAVGMLGNSTREMAGRYASNGAAGRFGGASARGSNRGVLAPHQRFGNEGFEQRGSTGNHSVFGRYQHGGMTRMPSDRRFSSMGAECTGGFVGGGMRGGGGGHGGGRR